MANPIAELARRAARALSRFLAIELELILLLVGTAGGSFIYDLLLEKPPLQSWVHMAPWLVAGHYIARYRKLEGHVTGLTKELDNNPCFKPTDRK